MKCQKYEEKKTENVWESEKSSGKADAIIQLLKNG